MTQALPTEITRKLRVAVLMGGTSTEREVSLVSGRMVAAALDPERYDVVALDTRDLVRLRSAGADDTYHELASLAADSSVSPAPGSSGANPSPLPVSRVPAQAGVNEVGKQLPSAHGEFHPGDCLERPDVVFIALHGKGGEDGTVQGMLEVMGIPYTGSGVLASALAMDKVMSKRVFKAAGIPIIDGIYVSRASMINRTRDDFERQSLRDVEAQLGFPVFVKPNSGGSTCGCTLVERSDRLFEAVQVALKLDDVALVERYVRGTEITIGVLDFAGEPPVALPVIEIVPKGEYYDYESKYADGGSEHIIPARLPQAQLERAQQIALECHSALGCRGVSRTDLIAAGNELVVLEVNTIPGMTPTSLLPQAAEHAGISFSALLDRLIRSAIAAR